MRHLIVLLILCSSCASNKATHFEYHKKDTKFVSNERLRKRHERKRIVVEAVAMFWVILFAEHQIEK